jgi:hypothetical protein
MHACGMHLERRGARSVVCDSLIHAGFEVCTHPRACAPGAGVAVPVRVAKVNGLHCTGAIVFVVHLRVAVVTAQRSEAVSVPHQQQHVCRAPC